jgi:hypothetical protein
MKSEELIRESLRDAVKRGVSIKRSATFDWTKPGPDGLPISSGELPYACDWCGAVFLYKEKEVKPPTAEQKLNRWESLAKLLGVNPFWLYRFNIGFSNNYQLMVEIQNKKTKDTAWVKDKISSLGIKIAKEFCK